MNSVDNSNGRGIWEWDLVKVILGLSFVLFAGVLLLGGYTEESVRKIIRWTARIDVFLFCLAFSATALHQWMQNSFSFWLMMNRRYWGVSFAILHLVHLAFLGLLQWSFHPLFELADGFELFVGGMAYVFVIVMLLTSFPVFAKPLSRRNWSRLHTFGGYWIWVVFMSSYWGRTLGGAYFYLPIALMLVLVLLLRLWVWRRKKMSLKGN